MDQPGGETGAQVNVALRPDAIDVISLCTGGAGLDLGIELAVPAARSVVLVEREAFAAARLVAAMRSGLLAAAPLWSDARTFDGRPWRGLVDGLIGGIPCQPHSLAGNRRGARDERDLWSPARRIIVQSRPWFVLIENVEGILSSGGAERVVTQLRRLGFRVEIGLFSAAEVGASQRRNRTFILAVADRESGTERAGPRAARYRKAAVGSFDESGALADADRNRGREGAEPLQPWAEQSRLAHAREAVEGSAGWRSEARQLSRLEASIESRSAFAQSPDELVGDANDFGECQPQGLESGFERWPEDAGFRTLFPPEPDDLPAWRDILDRSPQLEPAVRRVAHGVAGRVDELRLLGNGVVPLQAAYAFRTLCARLAAGGSAGAAFLIRMMEPQ